MEYAEEGDLGQILEKQEPIHETVIKSWLQQICLGLKYIHERRIIHRDLKPANIFLCRDNQVSLTHLGQAGRLWRIESLDQHERVLQHFHRNTLLPLA